ncbi:hypothetical protein [Rubinisphaera margarita]|uniref:hypothetical protein n=1 Tax=Rubinisphaera margarita TaxID=2909586 RepID=UPI001EE938DC|nr:hypothetical protein [Rubinisphaera margarita]MCG6157220.1 hypothetical protein [Rubinisphaera margarita]
MLQVAVLGGLCALFSGTSLEAGEYVKLLLVDGRTPVGQLVPQEPDSEFVMLQSSTNNIALVSRFPRWMVRDIQPIDALFVDAPNEPAFEPPRNPVEIRNQPEIQSLKIRAGFDSWDRDTQPDGLTVEIFPRAARRLPVDAEGTITFELFAERQHPLPHEERFESIGRWSVELSSEDYIRPGVAVVELPWRNTEPYENNEWKPLGLLTARLFVAGVGTFDASDANVPLREWSRFRDDLGLHRGSRYELEP